MRSALDGFLTIDGIFVSLNMTHINTVINDPEFFNLTGDYVKSIYGKYNEQMPVEGKARAEILIGLIKDGWMRVNYNVGRDRFTINVWDCGVGTLKALNRFSGTLVNDEYLRNNYSYSDFCLYCLSNGSLQMTDVQKLINNDFVLREIGVRKTDTEELF